MAEIAVTTLKTDPAAYPEKALFINGEFSFCKELFKLLLSITGVEAHAKISLVFESKTMPQPTSIL